MSELRQRETWHTFPCIASGRALTIHTRITNLRATFTGHVKK
jgi:hypothetical protein